MTVLKLYSSIREHCVNLRKNVSRRLGLVTVRMKYLSEEIKDLVVTVIRSLNHFYMRACLAQSGLGTYKQTDYI